MPKYQLDALRAIRSMQQSHEIAGHGPMAERMRAIGDQVEAMLAEHDALRAEIAALKEAARPVVEWWDGYGRFMDGKGPIPNPVLSVLSKTDICRVSEQQLDALAALVGEG